MKTNRLLLLSALLLVGAGALGNDSRVKCESNIPPTLEEIHLDWMGGATPPKPRSIFVPPVHAWYDATGNTLLIEPDTNVGWLTICLEDESENVLLLQRIDGNAGHTSIKLPPLGAGYYLLSIRGESPDSFLIAGWFEVY